MELFATSLQRDIDDRGINNSHQPTKENMEHIESEDGTRHSNMENYIVISMPFVDYTSGIQYQFRKFKNIRNFFSCTTRVFLKELQ